MPRSVKNTVNTELIGKLILETNQHEYRSALDPVARSPATSLAALRKLRRRW